MEMVLVILIITAVAAVIFLRILKNKDEDPVKYNENFNDGYVDIPPVKPKKEEKI
jgi:hypothetical protein